MLSLLFGIVAATHSSVNKVFKPNATAASILNDFVNKEEPHYGWKDTSLSWKTPLGGMAYKLNVTSLQWLDNSVYTIPNSTDGIWWHEVIVVVPEDNHFKNTSFFWGTGGYNDAEAVTGDKIHADIELVDALAADQRMIGVVGY